jgi:mono/diheme cytochrome c family protein
MMRVLKWIGIALVVLLGVIATAAVILSFIGGSKMNQTVEVQAENIPIPNDAAALERGEHLVKTACLSCHASDMTGLAIFDEPGLGTLYAPNLTALAEDHSDEELVLAIRHGVGHEGRPLMIMPSETFINFSAEDLGAIIAYLKTVPAAGEETPDPAFGFLAKVMLAAGMFGQIFPSEYIDHDQPFPQMPVVGANVEYGQYLSGMCQSCHGPDLTGGQPPEPDAPPAPDLTSGGPLASWTEAEFLTAMRTGVAPDGQTIDPDFMPWQSFGKLYDEELQALWIYLQE